MEMKKILAVATLTVTLSGIAAFAVQPENSGTLNITVLDENGAVVQDAPIYIYGEHKTKFVGGKDIPGTTTLSMPAGSYKISSAIVKKTGDYLDRFASHEAHIEVLPGDNTVVVLKLMAIDDAVASIGYAELRKMGVSPDLN
jgi:flagellar hook assembly protein FlgD